MLVESVASSLFLGRLGQAVVAVPVLLSHLPQLLVRDAEALAVEPIVAHLASKPGLTKRDILLVVRSIFIHTQWALRVRIDVFGASWQVWINLLSGFRGLSILALGFAEARC